MSDIYEFYCPQCGKEVGFTKFGTKNNPKKYQCARQLCPAKFDVWKDDDGRVVYNTIVPEIDPRLTPSPQARSKAWAIVFAIFGFGFASWIYTWDHDKYNFRFHIILFFLTGTFWIYVIWPAIIIMAIKRPKDFYRAYPNYVL